MRRGRPAGTARRHRFHNGLAGRLFLSVLIAGTAITAISVGIQLWSDYRKERAAVRATFDEIRTGYLPALTFSVFDFDTEQTRLMIEGIHLLPYVTYAELREPRNNEQTVTIAVGPGVPDEYVAHTFDLDYEYGEATRHLGQLKVYADLTLVQSRVREQLGSVVFSHAVQVLVVSSLILFLAHRVIVKPLKKTSRFVRTIELSEETESRLTLPMRREGSLPRDELDEIVSSINLMKQRLTEAYRELRESKKRLQASNDQKDELLRELNHRTKNNMQVITSLLSMKAARTPDDAAVQQLVGATEARIYALALVHEKLYQSADLSRIRMDEYLTDLTRFVVASRCDGPGIPRLEVKTADTKVLFDTAIPCGLVVTELVTNALQHAFDHPAEGLINVSLEAAPDGHFRLSVQDNGRGLPEEFDPDTDADMGIRLVYSLGKEQLGGSVYVESPPGTTWILEFQESVPEDQV